MGFVSPESNLITTMEYLKTNFLITIVALAVTGLFRCVFTKPRFPLWVFLIHLLWLIPGYAFYTLGCFGVFIVPASRLFFHALDDDDEFSFKPWVKRMFDSVLHFFKTSKIIERLKTILNK